MTWPAFWVMISRFRNTMRVDVKPGLLRWAAERSRIEPDVLAERFPKLQAWEMGEVQPTLKQLEDFARATHTPIGYFFLPAPPVERLPIPDFRTVAGARLQRPSPDLLDTIHLCQQRQEWYREFARTVGERPLAFAGAAAVTSDVIEAGERIRHSLGFDLEERRRMPTWTDALRRFIELADNAGVMVMVSGVVGSNNRRKLDPYEFRGFALADPLAPLVFVNGSDTKAAQMFTLAHELAHIWLGQSAVSDARTVEIDGNAIERWCNAVAAELLVPLAVLSGDYDRRADLWAETARLARRFKVSTLVILRRMHDAGGLTRPQFRAADEAELTRLLALPTGSGGNFYLTLGARASKRFARALVVSTLEGRSSFTEAFRLLGFSKMSTFRELGQNLGLAV
jgi:Zn-dependent peptidase ImmA (M78 family)